MNFLRSCRGTFYFQTLSYGWMSLLPTLTAKQLPQNLVFIYMFCHKHKQYNMPLVGILDYSNLHMRLKRWEISKAFLKYGCSTCVSGQLHILMPSTQVGPKQSPSAHYFWTATCESEVKSNLISILWLDAFVPPWQPYISGHCALFLDDTSKQIRQEVGDTLFTITLNFTNFILQIFGYAFSCTLC